GGNWSRYRERKALELAAAEHDLADAEKQVAGIRKAAQARAERQDRRDSGGRSKAAKGDMPKILAGGRKERAEATRGEGARLAGRRAAQAQEAASEARRRIEVLQPFSVALASTGLPAGRTVLRMDNVNAGYMPERP